MPAALNNCRLNVQVLVFVLAGGLRRPLALAINSGWVCGFTLAQIGLRNLANKRGNSRKPIILHVRAAAPA